jgi:hypothetical protein
MIIRIKNKIDLNSLIRWSNLIIIISIISLFCFLGSNPYINGVTILLSIILAIENYILLKIEMKKRNPFILLLVLNLVFFYLTRPSTLLLIPDIADALNRGLFPKVNEINYALIFIIVSIIPVAYGLYTDAFNSKVMIIDKANSNIQIKPFIVILLFGFSIFFVLLNLYNASLIPTILGKRMASYLGVFLTNPVILLVVFTYLISYYNYLSNKQRNTIFIMVGIFLVMTIIGGSRSGIIQIIFTVIFSSLAVNNYIELKRKIIVILLIVIMPLSFFAFGLATYIRAANSMNLDYEKRNVNLIGTVLAINDYIKSNKDITASLGNVFQRIGFLDMATEMIANKEAYGEMINIEYETKSIINSTYHYPLVSNALRYIYSNRDFSYTYGADLLSDFGGYHSDQLTIFGEYYNLFKGYYALIAFLFFGFCFRTIYLIFCTHNSFNYNLIRSFLLYLFYNFWLNSFGMDWMVLNTIMFGISLIAYILVFNLSTKIKIRRIKPVVLGD